jgi:hydroxymethylbilane synthase
MRIVLGTRGSDLALAQTQLVECALLRIAPDIELQRRIVQTTGDMRQDVALSGQKRSEHIPQGLFVKEIEELLLTGVIDAAVHSLKDLPTTPPDALVVAACLERASVMDVLLTKAPGGVSALRSGAVIATGSPRRAAQMKVLRPDVSIVPVRGNVTTRMKKLVEIQEWDAMILARAGLERLGVLSSGGDRASVHDGGVLWMEELDLEFFLPAPGQAAIAVEVRREDKDTREVVARIDHPATSAAVRAERAWLAGMGGGCHVPMAALGRVNPETHRITLRAADYGDGKCRCMAIEGEASDPECLGMELARRFREGD